jgi:hypothetical protein
VKILNLFARSDITFIYNKFQHTNDLHKKNFKTIMAFTKSTDLVIRAKKIIKISREIVPLSDDFSTTNKHRQSVNEAFKKRVTWLKC